jgi:DNA-directed RNA polymerase subunit K
MEALNKYERARIIGARGLQIGLGAPVLVELPKGMMHPLDIARLELEKDMIPIAIKRE